MPTTARSKALQAAVQTGNPVVLIAEPGVGKTAWWKALAAAFNRFMEVIIPATMDPTDVQGSQMALVVDGKPRTITTMPYWLERLHEAAARGVKTILFQDEITNTPRSTQGALLNGLQTGNYGPHSLPADCWTVLAANPPECAADGIELSPPMANRMFHFKWEIDIPSWADAMIDDFPVPVAYPVSDNWKNGIQKWQTLIGMYAKVRPQAIQAMPKNDPVKMGEPWPSQRTWRDLVCTGLAALDSISSPKDPDYKDAQIDIVSAAIGGDAAITFITWLYEQDLPKPEDLLKNPEAWVPKENRNDINFVALATVAQYVDKNLTPENYVAGWKLMKVAADKKLLDVACIAARDLARIFQRDLREGRKLPKVTEEMKPFVKFLTDIGAIK